MTMIKTFIIKKNSKKYTVGLCREKEIVFERHPGSGFPKSYLCDVITGGIPSKRKWNFCEDDQIYVRLKSK